MTLAMKQQNNEVRDQLARSAEGVPLIGWFVYWSITNVKANYTDLVALMSSVGLNTDAATPIRGKSAFIRSVEDVAKANNARHQKILDNEARTVYIVVKTHVDSVAMDASFTTETKAIFNKASETIEVQGPFQSEIQSQYDDLKNNYYSDQFRDMILRLMDRHCEYIAIRDRGGIYFVPSLHEEGLDLIKVLFKSFPECYFATVGVANMGEAKKEMWRTLMGEVTTELSKMKVDLSTSGPEMSNASMQVRLDRYQALKQKVENYEIVLSGTADALKNELNDLTQLLHIKLTT